MANMYDISGLTYQPSSNMDWYTRAIFGGKLIERGKITPVIGVKESTYLNLIDIAGNILQADTRDCAWTPQQIAKLSEKLLSIKTYKINLEQCLDDLERKRTIWMMSPGARNTELPDGLEEATMAMLAAELSKEIETKIFNGDQSSNANDFNGITKVLTDSTQAIKVAGVALTKANVLGEIEKAFALLPEDVMSAGLERGSLNIYVSHTTLVKVKMALGGVFGANVVVNPNVTIEGDIVRYMGVEIVSVKGIEENDIIIADATNFLLGTDLLSDLEEIRLGQFPAPNDNKIFIDGRLRLGFAIPFEDEVVFYSPDNEDEDEDFISADSTNLVFPAAGGSDTVTITASGPYTASNAPTGFSKTIVDNVMTVTATTDNTGGPSAKTGSIVVTLTSDPSKTVTITLNQPNA